MTHQAGIRTAGSIAEFRHFSIDFRGELSDNVAVRRHASAFVLATALFCQYGSADPTSWISGEIAYRVTVVPQGSVGSRIGLRIGDILAEPGPLPARLRDAPGEGVEIPLFRLQEGQYRRTRIKVTFLPGEDRRLGLTGDFGFLVSAIQPESLGTRAKLRSGDFIEKINETFVHRVEDLKRIDKANSARSEALIHIVRWTPETNSFQDLTLRSDVR